MHAQLINDGNVVKNVKVGFSWTTLLFGCFPALFRGDLKWALIMFFIALLLGVLTYGFGAIITSVIFAFIYNKIYIKELIEKGYRPLTHNDEEILRYAHIISQT